MTPLRWLRLAVKAAMRWPGAGYTRFWGPTLGRTRYDYRRDVGDGRGNAVVVACVNWLCRTFPEAPLRVQRRTPEGELEPVPQHPLAARLAAPNTAYSGVLLWMATLGDWMLSGNAYWLKVRAETGRVSEIWWLPARQVEPRWPDDGSGYVSHYEYTVDGAVTRYAVADVVHFRYGLDPDNPRKGCSPLAALVREIFTDDEAANYTASVLRNVGVPGVVISPEAAVSRDQAQQTKDWVREHFGGDYRGEPMVMPSKTNVTRLAYNPTEMDVKTLRRVPEERVSAVFGIPAVVVGLGAGLDRSTFANYAEAREAAYESNVIPTQRLFAAEITTQLLPDFGDAADLVVDFDLSAVRVLQPDLDALYSRLSTAVGGGWLTVNEARHLAGKDDLPGGDVVYVPSLLTPTDPADLLPPEPVAPPPEALSGPPALQALPPPKRLRPADPAAKSRHRDPTPAIRRLRARLQTPFERDLAAYLAAEAEVVAGAIERKDVRRVLTAAERFLTDLLRTWYRRALGGVHVVVEDALGTSFDLGDERVQAYLARAGANVAGITETTRAAIAQALRAGQAAGESTDQIAARIRGLPEVSPARARTIARTELAYATQYAAVDAYRASGVVTHVDVHDGDGDGPCAAANGQRWTLAEAAANPIEHPSCVRAFSPVVDEAAGAPAGEAVA